MNNPEIGLYILEIGSVLVVGFISAFFFKKLRIPQVLGYILVGVLIGIPNRYWFEFISFSSIDNFMPFVVTVALGLIGFNIGAELSWEKLKQIDKRILIILFSESIGSFLLVSLLVGFLTNLSWGFAFILGALASATAPAASAEVLWEYKSKGPLTQAILFILAIDDIIAIILVQITTQVAKSQIPGETFSGASVVLDFTKEVLLAIIIGIIAGIIISWAINRVKHHGEILEVTIGSLVVLIGFSMFIGTSAILTTMFLGIIIISFTRRKEKETKMIFQEISKLSSPLIAFFFILVGLKMDFSDIKYIGIIGSVYLLGRVVGKIGFANITARITRLPKKIHSNIGFCLLTQGGVALGLAVHINTVFLGTIFEEQAKLVLAVVTGTILIVEIIGPLLVKWAIHRAGEVDKTDQQNGVIEDLFDKEKEINEKGDIEGDSDIKEKENDNNNINNLETLESNTNLK